MRGRSSLMPEGGPGTRVMVEWEKKKHAHARVLIKHWQRKGAHNVLSYLKPGALPEQDIVKRGG